MVYRKSLDGPWVCSWCGFKDWDIKKLLNMRIRENINPNGFVFDIGKIILPQVIKSEVVTFVGGIHDGT